MTHARTRGRTGSAQRTFRDGVFGVTESEIEPGRSVPGDWNEALIERWVDRKAKRAVERATRVSA